MGNRGETIFECKKETTGTPGETIEREKRETTWRTRGNDLSTQARKQAGCCGKQNLYAGKGT